MLLHVNGQPTDLPTGLTARQLLEHMALTGKRLAVEVNGEIVPRSGHAAHELREGDKVEIVHAIGGG
ncbi:MAG TPA: sulfur carrier protein ThiS [Gammaproteobacteria bacterium]|jgi:sulfur carrier protein